MQNNPSQDTYSAFYNKKFPEALQENFQAEATALWQELERDLLEACKPNAPDFDLLVTLLPRLEVFLTVYAPNQKRKEMLATLFLRILLEERTTTVNKVIIIRVILVTIGGGNLKNLRLNWKALYDYLEEAISDPVAQLAVGSHSPKGKLVKDIAALIRRVRVLYPEESTEEVLRLLRQLFSPAMSSGYKSSLILSLFFNTGLPDDKSFKQGQEYYEKKVIPELMAFWTGRRYQWEPAYLVVLGRIARKYPKIDWSPYYDQLFTFFFNAVKAEFPQKDSQSRAGSIGVRGVGAGWASLAPKRADVTFVPDLLVRIMVPKTAPGGEQFWENVERIYRSTLPFIHPENNGAWSGTLARFYSEFCKLYIKRALKEQRKTGRGKPKTGEEMEEEKEVILEDRPKEDEKEDVAPLDEVDMGFFEDEEEEEGEKKEEEDEQEDEDQDEEDEQQEGQKDLEAEKAKYLLDEDSHKKFMEMMVYVIKNLMYSRDNKVIDVVAKTCRRLLFFRPEEFAPLLFKMLYGFFERSDLSHIGFIKVLLLTAYPLLNRRSFKQGLYEVPKILDITLEHLTSHDLPKTALLLELYEVIFSLVPIYHPEDLKDKYQALNGSADVKAIKDKLNNGEENDLWQLSEDISDWAVKFFKKFVDLLKHFERKEGGQGTKSTALVVSYRNLHSLIFQSSPRIIQKYLDTLRTYLEDNLQKPPSQYLPDILQPLNLRDANSTLTRLLPVFKDQLLTKLASPKSETNSKRPLYTLIQKSSVAAIFDQYELKITNKETLGRMLTTLQDLLAFSSPALLQHRQDIELIILHGLLHEDHGVFDKASQLFHTVLLSLLSVYPTNLGSLNPQDLSKNEFTNIYRKVGKTSKRNIEIEWHTPSEEEKQYARDLFNLLFSQNLQEIEANCLQGITAKKPDFDTLTTLIDDMHLKKTELSGAQRENLARSLSLVNYAFLGVSQRASYAGIADLSEHKKKFEANFSLDVCNGARERLCDVGNRLVQFTFSNLYIRDPYIGKALVQLIGTMYGEEEQYDELQRKMKTLRQKKRAFELENARGEMYENRYLMALHIGIKLQERILGYSADFNYKENAQSMLFILWLFSFHPNEEVAKIGLKILRRRVIHLVPQKKNELFSKFAEYTEKLVNERFSFLKNNAKDLEESKTLKFKQNEIIYNNKDSYVDILLKGVLRNLDYLLPYLTINLDYLFQFIQILLDVPKTDDASFLLRFARLINGIDFSPYISEKDQKPQDESKEKLILRTSDIYDKFEQSYGAKKSTEKTFYDSEKLKPHVEAQMTKVIFALSQEEAHWKYQVVAAFTGALLCRFLPAKSELLSQFIVCIFKLLASGHYYLRYFAVSAFPALIKMHTEEFRKNTEIKRKPEDFKGLKLSLDEAFKYHFIKKEDYQNNYIKDPHVGILDFYDELEVDNLKDKPKNELPKDLTDTIQGRDFLRRLIDNLVSDVPSQEEVSQKANTGGIAGLLGKMAFNFKGYISEFFRQSTHKKGKSKPFATITSLFSLVEASLLRALLKYFDGPKVFENSIDMIEDLARDYNSREKQVVAAHYFFAAFKTFKFWDKASSEKAAARLAEMLSNVLDNVSAENHMIWSLAFANAVNNLDYRITKVFLDKLLQNPFEKKLSNIQGRYLSIYDTVMDRNGVFSEEIAERFLDIFTTFKPTETRQVEHITSVMVGILKNYVLNPVNYKKLKEEGIVDNIDATIQTNPKEYVLERDYFLYRFNKKFDQILQNYAQWARETPNPEENKIYFELPFILARSFYSKKLPYSLYVYYEKTILFLLQLNSDENLSLSLNAIQAHKESINSLSKLSYPKEALPVLINTVESCLKAKNPKVRENALKFYHYFYYNHIFHLKDRSIDLAIDSLLDENPAVKNEAFDTVTDIIRVYTEKEIRDTVEKYKKLVEDNKPKKSVESVGKGLYVLMAVVLSKPYEIEEWTDSVIEFLFAMKKYSKPANEKFTKEFAVKFWDSHKGRANINERALSYEVYSDLREIGNPSSYFA